MSQSAYSRNFERPLSSRDPTIPRFHMEPVLNEIASAAKGRPIFDEQERVQIIQPGNPNSPVFMVTDEYRHRWPEQYKAFREGQEMAVTGVPLEQWPILRRNQVMELKALGIHSVEQCAGLSDQSIQKIGMGGRRLRDLAAAYLDEADQMKITTAADARAERAETALAEATAQLAELRPLLDRLHADNMAMKNAPAPVHTFVPGDNLHIGQPGAPPIGSSLDGLQPRQGRRRRETEEAVAA